MAHATSPSLVRQLGSLYDGSTAAGLSDRQLLERFNARRDVVGEAAFAALVARHGPMVLGVCRELLGDRHHAEDAFQAVFLVLARKGCSLREPELLGNWLYGVTVRTARKARGQRARRRKTEEDGAVRDATAQPAAAADQAMLDREQAEALHREIDRLPGAFRWPVVLCYFECLTLDEAAERLQWPVGTLRSRLARAREKLRRGLLRRGVALSGTALAAALAPRSAAAFVSPLLCDTTTRAATAFVARHAASGILSATATTLAQEILRAMLFHKLRLITMPLLLLAAVAAGAGSLNRLLAMGDGPKSPPAARPAPVAAKPDDTAQRAAPGRMTVVGRVLDPQGREVVGATVMVYAATKQGGGSDRPTMVPVTIGQESSDRSGRFQIDATRTSSARHHRVGATAIAPGYGAGWADLDVDADQPTVEITLRPEHVIEGRLFDVQGQPAQGVRVSIKAMGHPRPELKLPANLDGPSFWGDFGAKDLPAWPRPAITDADGRFTLHGIGRDLRGILLAEDPRFAPQRIVADTDTRSGSKPLTMALEPAKVIEGRVTCADTGKPVSHAAVRVVTHQGSMSIITQFETNGEGRYRANPFSAEHYSVTVRAPEGTPYLNASPGPFAWTKGALDRRLDLALNRGTLLRGRVTEEGSGAPVAGATLGLEGRRGENEESGGGSGLAETGPDGCYQLAAVPKPATLVVLGPSDDYVFQETSGWRIHYGEQGGQRWYAHAFVECNLKPTGDTREVNVVLRRGITAKARVVGPDGEAVEEAHIFSRALMLPQSVPMRLWSGRYHGSVRNGRCELHGLAPDAEVPVFFLDPKRQIGARTVFSGKAAAEGLLTVRLEPCGTARARLVDAAAKPLAGYRDRYLISLVVTPGLTRGSRKQEDKNLLWADQDDLSPIDPIHYGEGVTADPEGRVMLPALIPGAAYRIYDWTQFDDNGGRPLRTEFVARTGEVLELGDIVIAKPKE